ncbi:hypothetical protein RxyAA322_20170 [Rubrobacter xylanophilus]|uniref:Rieske domain-containing protein n=1 Tax=Rubrobacter xylanophilus TaxID=49319 RepID=A0A510HNB4_9ACTN|nr:Rieske 2Fe-2S domain-containing protein [Rubrobacter xylanophilus]BBL80163.1 hypothetical protein RxyAA322_20170 [Rubrobacter xylanophilus]
MAKTIGERIVEAMPFLEGISDAVQPRVREAVEAGGRPVRNLLDGTWMEVPLHPVLTDVPVGAWTSTLVFDGLDVISGRRAARNAADASLAFGLLGGLAAAVAGLSDWRYLMGHSRRMGAAHGLFNTAGLALAAVSLGLRAAGRRNAGRAAFLAGYTLAGVGAHLGGELSYGHGLRVDRNALRGQEGPEEFVPVLKASELPAGGMRRVSADGAEVLLARSSDGEICAISAVCGHFGGALDQGRREGDTVVCPLHGSRFDLCSGKVIDGPAVFPQPRYEVRVRGEDIEIRSAGI